MSNKKNEAIKDALTLGTKRVLPKKSTKNLSEIEQAANKIHSNNTAATLTENVVKEAVKKTSLHIPMDLYATLKMEAFKNNVTLRKLIISTLEEKFK